MLVATKWQNIAAQMSPTDPPWLQFVSIEIEPLAGMLSGFLVGSLFAFWPKVGVKLYAPLFEISPKAIRIFGYLWLAWGVWSTLILIAHRLGYTQFDVLP
jgi:hypothetical protein